MRRIHLTLALIGAVAAAGCGKTSTSDTGGNRGVAEGTFKIFVQNGQNGNTSLALKGFVTSTPAGIDCGVAPHGVCEAEFPLATTVTLTATAAAGSEFFGFAGDCSGDTCVLNGTTQGAAEKYVLAQFGLPQNQTGHPNWTSPAEHGPRYWAAQNGNSGFECASCHGYVVQGMGLAPACGKCHGSTATAKFEDCATCHTGGQYGTAVSPHVLADQLGVVVSNVAASVSGSDVVITYNVQVNGVNRDDFLRKASEVRNHNEDAWWRYDTATSAGVRTKLPFTAGPAGGQGSSTALTIASLGSGNYRATLAGLGTSAAAGNAYMISAMAGTTGFGTTATVTAWYGARTHDVVSDQACVNCHGQLVWRDAVHDVTYPQGVGPCIVCHSRTGAQDPRLPGAGSGLLGIVHGVHNSKNMPDGQYTFTWTNGNKFNFSVGFPGYMDNCQTCHQTTAELAAVAAAPLSYAVCISCHDSFAAFPSAPASHLTFATSQTCAGCHPGETVATYHNGLVTERAGLIWDGADQSVVLAPTVVLGITGVTVSGSNVVVTWTAKNGVTNTDYNPCNQDFAAGPVFVGYVSPLNRTEGCTNTVGGCNSNFSLLRAYAQGDDWTNNGLTGATSPGQPRSVNLSLTNTTCSGNVATSTIAAHAWDAGFDVPTKGIVALQGKPQVRWAPNGNIIWVRSQTPTREFVVATGTPPATVRREIVDVNKCNACHLGTLYQHGGTRVDKIELCVMCHDPASSEQQNRVGMGVTAAEAYDGLPGQTYDMRYMVHAIHAAGENGKQLMFYRSNGIYFFGSLATLATVPNWPAGDQCISCVDVEDGPLTYCKVYGSSATGEKPVANPDGTCGTPVTSTDGTWRPHRVVEVHYPRALNDCSACHIDSSPALPDPLKAAAVTVDAGVAPWNNGNDDVVMGSSAASCFSCHAGPAAQQTILRNHAYDLGFTPFQGGRQQLLDAAP